MARSTLPGDACTRVRRTSADAALDAEVPAGHLVALSARRRRHGTPTTLVPRDLRYLFAREAPLRLMTASVLAPHGPSPATAVTGPRDS